MVETSGEHKEENGRAMSEFGNDVRVRHLPASSLCYASYDGTG